MALVSRQTIEAKLYSAGDFQRVVAAYQAKDLSTVGDGIGIFPFRRENLGSFNYDLTVGNEVYSLRRAEKLPVTDVLGIEPGETVLILTEEYLALGPQFAGLVVSKARVMDEGVANTVARVDPTWHGKLIVPVTNQTKQVFKFRKGSTFCTLVFLVLDQPIPREHYIDVVRVPFLGQTTLQYASAHAELWIPKPPKAVTPQDLAKAVDLFGPPFDVVRGSIEGIKEELLLYIEKEIAPNIVKETANVLVKEAFRIQNRLLALLITGFLGVFLLLAWLLAYSILK